MEFLLYLQFFLFFILLPLYFYYYYILSSPNKPTANTQNKTNSGFKAYPILGVLPEFLKNRNRFLDWTAQVLADCPTNTAVFHRFGNVRGVITANPLNVEYMLKTSFEDFPKGPQFINRLEDFLGRGIFNSDGETWKFQRKTASYEFNTKSLRNFVMEIVTVEIRTRLLPILSKASETRGVLDLQDILERFAFDNICKLAFKVDPGCLGGDGTAGTEFMGAFEDAATLSSGRFMYAFEWVWKVKRFFSLGTEKRLKDSISTVHRFADDIIRSRMEAKETNQSDKDLLSRFIANQENPPEPAFLRDIVISFILAGRDTTSSALSWFFWILSTRPDVKRNIIEELKMIRDKNGKNIGDAFLLDELRDMQYLQAAISETMRLFPPVPVDTKACMKEAILPDGTYIGKNWFMTYQTYAMGRMETIWGKDCNEYKPERWMEENGMCRQESPFRFPVFHGGPRMCLGKDMAYIHMKVIAASVMERFEIEVENSCMDKYCPPEHVLSLTLRMKQGLPIKVHKREENMRA